MNNKLSIYNGFGIVPTSSYTAAGLDFYIPNINTSELAGVAIKAFEKSYNKTEQEINEDWDILIEIAKERNIEVTDIDCINILHLYYALDNISIRNRRDNPYNCLTYFIENKLDYNEDKNVYGVIIEENDALCINSGIKVALDKDTTGIFFNKSGRGNEGWDVRAQVVDEDYTGYVHLSVAFTKEVDTCNKVIYCGDKLTQMVVLPIIHKTCFEISEDEYNNLLANSKRGTDWNGSTN